eukprot:306229_1
MAFHQVETEEGAGEDRSDQELKQWLNANNLIQIQPKLKEQTVSLDELRELSKFLTMNQLREYAQNELSVNIVYANRFANAVHKLSTDSLPQMNNPNIVRIVLSQEEDDALNGITRKKEEIQSKTMDILKNVKTLKGIMTTNENQINTFRKELIVQLNKRMDELISISNGTAQKTITTLNQAASQLTVYTKQLSDAESQTNSLLQDTSINALNRKQQIMNISKAILSSIQMPQINVTPKIVVQFDKEKILKYIGVIGAVDDCEAPPPPPNISVKDIKSTFASVHIRRNKSSDAMYSCVIEMCKKNEQIGRNDNDDEKRNNADDVQWKTIATLKDNEDVYHMASLVHCTTYKIRAKYNHKNRFGPYSKILQFKTKRKKKQKKKRKDATFSNIYKGSGITLSENNTKATGSDSGHVVRATDPIQRGQVTSWEFGMYVAGESNCAGVISSQWTYFSKNVDDVKMLYAVDDDENYGYEGNGLVTLKWKKPQFPEDEVPDELYIIKITADWTKRPCKLVFYYNGQTLNGTIELPILDQKYDWYPCACPYDTDSYCTIKYCD